MKEVVLEKTDFESQIFSLAARFKFLSYQGSDLAIDKCLRKNFQQFSCCPLSFWWLKSTLLRSGLVNLSSLQNWNWHFFIVLVFQNFFLSSKTNFFYLLLVEMSVEELMEEVNIVEMEKSDFGNREKSKPMAVLCFRSRIPMLWKTWKNVVLNMPLIVENCRLRQWY